MKTSLGTTNWLPILITLTLFGCGGKRQGHPIGMESALIFPLDNKPTPECHASTLAETSKGLVCAFFAGTHEKHPDVGIRVSRYVDGKWTWPQEVANGIQNQETRYPCWNPVLFQPQEGPLLLFYKVGLNPREWWGMLMTSEDHGQTWSEPRRLGESAKIGSLLGPVKNKPIQLSDGTILCPSSTEAISEENETQWKVHFELTRDLGKTWEVIGPINDGIEFDAIQPTLLTYQDGGLQMLCRTREDVVAQSWSADGGHSWGRLEATSLPNPSSGIDGISLIDGRQLLVYNPTIRGGKSASGRHLLQVALSVDGIDWEPILTLENDTVDDAGYSYPAVIQAADGRIHITYTYRRESIKHVILDPDGLE